uniref:Uncharacterized protein n=1 Tax=Panagrolaimus sp. PS1159 TaxID=55785 RepID=A0AC35FXK0_9BILA
DAPKPPVSVFIEHDEKSTTSVSNESLNTTSVASSLSKTTSSKSSSASSKDKSKPGSAKSSVETSVAEDLPTTAQSATSSDFSSFLPSNRENNSQTIKKNTVAADNKLTQHSPADEVSEYSFSFSGNSQTNDQQKTAYNRRKSWDMVETGIIGKQSPSYLKNDTIDNDTSGIFNNEPPKFESAPSPLGPYAVCLHFLKIYLWCSKIVFI